MSYYDIDAILTDAQKIPTTFTHTNPHLGYLDNTPSLPLKSGTQLQLPLWLSEMLAVSSPTPNSTLVTLDLPASLSPRILNALKASPKSVDLRQLAQNFYGLGARILELFEEEEVCDVLMESWRVRAQEISDQAGNVGARGGAGQAADGVEFLRGLDEWERGLFRAGHEGAKAMKVWMGEVKKG